MNCWSVDIKASQRTSFLNLITAQVIYIFYDSFDKLLTLSWCMQTDLFRIAIIIHKLKLEEPQQTALDGVVAG